MSDSPIKGATEAGTRGLRGTALAGIGLMILALVACGGGGGGGGGDGGDGGSATNTGIFVDSPVEGLRYVTNSLEGQTDANGRFNYRAGEMVQFYVGDILIGAAAGALELSPIDLVPGAANENDPVVTNIARFLQTIDDDGNPSNGIRITNLVADLARGEAINFNQSISAFENDGSVQVLVSSLSSATPAGARSLVPASAAQAHLRGSLLGLLEGNWVGQFSRVVESGPYAGERCDGEVTSRFDNVGRFYFSTSGSCGTVTNGFGEWSRSGNSAIFEVESLQVVGGNTLVGHVTDEGQRITVGRRALESGYEVFQQMILTRE